MTFLENVLYYPYQKYKKIIRDHFSFLNDEYGFKEISSEMDSFGVRVIFCNFTTGVRISYDARKPGFLLQLIRLINGEIPDYPTSLNNENAKHHLNLEHLLEVRKPKYLKKLYESRTNKQDYENIINEMANCLKRIAKDVLQGDFKVFDEIYKFKNQF